MAVTSSVKNRRPRTKRRLALVEATPEELAQHGGPALLPRLDTEREKKDILKRLGDLSSFDVFGNRVLVAQYIRHRVSANIYAASQTQTEDRWQGKVGLVIRLGPQAFVDDDRFNFCGKRAKVGDWVVFSVSDGTALDLVREGSMDRVPCKMILDDQVAAVISRPDIVY